MTDAHDLHQIEYRHHQTRDLSPVASSMSSPDSLRAWDSRIRAWVRHPHADRLSESVCYQVLSTGQAALAWRYWDQRAAARADGTRGRPLVSRVLVGQASVLTPEVAVALCRAGLTADLAGPLPGEVPDGAELPTVSGDALAAVTHEMATVLDQDAARQAGLQAVVAAALADPSTPLAISVRDNLIQKPLREGVQCPLLWGLRRIAGPLLGPVGRGWSFSTFELPLGEMDPASLPGIVFRQAQDGVQAPPARWRKEVKVRPLASDALDPGAPYAGRVELAGWLVGEYQERGGDGLAQFIVKCCGSERSLQERLERIHDELRGPESPLIVSPGPATFVSLADDGSPSWEEPESAGPDLAEPGQDERAGDFARADAVSLAVAAEPSQPEPREPDSPSPAWLQQLPPPQPPPPQQPPPQQPPPQQPPPPQQWGQYPPPQPWASQPPQQQWPSQPPPQQQQWPQPPPPQPWPESEPATPGETAPGVTPARAEPVVGGSGDQERPGYREPWRAGFQSPAREDEWVRSLAPSREGQTAPQLPVPDVRGQQAGLQGVSHPARAYQSPQPPVTVSYLLKQLELVRDDTEQFNAILQSIQHAGQSADPNDRAKSWEVISNKYWYDNIARHRNFHAAELAGIFGIVVIPELAGPGAADAVIQWACAAPPPMIGGLLAAARMASPEMWQAVMRLLEPVLAARWAADCLPRDLWDADRIMRAAAELARGEGKRGVVNRLRRR